MNLSSRYILTLKRLLKSKNILSEIEFLITIGPDIVPIEVKSGKRTKGKLFKLKIPRLQTSELDRTYSFQSVPKTLKQFP
jgi:hypothetical protein